MPPAFEVAEEREAAEELRVLPCRSGLGGVSFGETAPVDRHKNRSSEFAAAVHQLVENKGHSMVPLMRSAIVRHAMQEGANEQARVLLGQDIDPDGSLFEGGLVASLDGLSWSLPR